MLTCDRCEKQIDIDNESYYIFKDERIVCEDCCTENTITTYSDDGGDTYYEDGEVRDILFNDTESEIRHMIKEKDYIEQQIELSRKGFKEAGEDCTKSFYEQKLKSQLDSKERLENLINRLQKVVQERLEATDEDLKNRLKNLSQCDLEGRNYE